MRLCRLLRKTDKENTFIIFTSDNGDDQPNGTLRGGKANLYEGGLRVPFVVSGPDAAGGSVVAINQWDLLPL